MTVFEFVLALTSVVAGLALAHMISGVISLLRNARRVKFSLVHALWMWTAFATTIGNWASDWELRSMTEWPAWTLLLIITSKIAQYAFCVFVTPEIPPEGEIDLNAFHKNERRGYLLAALVFCAIAMIFNISFGGAFLYSQWLRDSVITLVAAGSTLVALFVSARWAQFGAGAVSAALAAYFLLAVSHLGAT